MSYSKAISTEGSPTQTKKRRSQTPELIRSKIDYKDLAKKTFLDYSKDYALRIRELKHKELL